VEQLTATLRELQLVTSRQIGLYKRQLHLKDNSLQALQEELMMDRGQQAPAISTAGASVSGSSLTVSAAMPPTNGMDAVANAGAGSQRNSRRHMVQVPSASTTGGGGSLTTSAYQPSGGERGLFHSASERRTAATAANSHRSGHTPRPSDNERGRGAHAGSTPTAAPGKKDPRDRSLGAMPHSPRPKARDIGLSGSAAVGEGPASRRRTMPPVAGRSTSAEERSRASWRRRMGEQEAHLSSQKVLRGAPARESGVPQTARQRR
jgi:hypothetical protein